MRFYSAGKSYTAWLEDNRLFMDAYHATERDPAFKNEIKNLEVKYIKKHLVELAGEENAERILAENGL